MSKTIAAASTPVGGAVAMIRISGDKADELLTKLCGKELTSPRKAYFVTVDTGTLKDDCIAIRYDAGGSYTGEKCAEIFCHGSGVIVSEVLKFLIANGASEAERGEFTMRAYQNKKIDLTEAEGILDLINSQTVEQAVNAYDSADGKLNRKITELQNSLKKVLAAVEVAIDYPEENIEETTIASAKEKIKPIIAETDDLIKGYDDGRKIKEGVRVVISGKPNVGKSSLFNAIMGYKRAIVNAKPGTTRDMIEGEYFYKGRKFVLCDTAGLRETSEEIELEGIAIAKQAFDGADVIVGVGTAADEYDFTCEKKVIKVSNKSDIKRGAFFNVSSLTGSGIPELKEEIYKATDFEAMGLKISSFRQFEALTCAKESLCRALDCTGTVDCFAADLSLAYDSLGKITGAIGSDEVIAEIFSAFCVGK